MGIFLSVLRDQSNLAYLHDSLITGTGLRQALFTAIGAQLDQ